MSFLPTDTRVTNVVLLCRIRISNLTTRTTNDFAKACNLIILEDSEFIKRANTLVVNNHSRSLLGKAQALEYLAHDGLLSHCGIILGMKVGV
jgi:hypothetical protein